ncbi:hypothetical protein ACFVW1_49075 [Streptomyces olivochromogenes]|uniref:hypothetical protein n=1 Tax=Streptomyces olivochromogenes TaxID=1963 RepID=UPI0036D9F6B5
MNSMTKRVSMALASTALAGGALLGAGGSASAATASVPVQHTQYVSVTSATSSEQAGRHTDDRRDDHRGQDTVRYVRVADHKGEAASWHGVSAARWYEDQVDEAASWHGVSAARWYEDQVVWSLDHS